MLLLTLLISVEITHVNNDPFDLTGEFYS